MTNSEAHAREQPTGDADDDQLRVTLTVGGRAAFLEMMQLLDESEISVRTEDIIRSTAEGPNTVAVDMGKLTEKQRRTLELALDVGYYEEPRRADLGDLADRTGVSKSAISQRLRAGEAKLVKNVFGEFR
ncbi:helix-turn-helix domain-containing protein [Natrialbaceae archaeon GCM10025896]